MLPLWVLPSVVKNFEFAVISDVIIFSLLVDSDLL